MDLDPISLTPARVAVLHALLLHGPVDAAVLTQRANLADELVAEFLQQLQTHGDVAAGPRGWALTPQGRVLASRVFVNVDGEVAQVPY